MMKKWNGNVNHVVKGTRLTVDPIRRISDIKNIRLLLQSSHRNDLLFVMGINNGLRMIDLLRLKVNQVQNLKAGDSITIKEGKTGKDNILVINNTTYKALRKYLNVTKLHSDDFLFKSRKRNIAISSQASGDLVKKWCKAIGLKGNYGSHTLRKTWGYIQRTKNGVGFDVICKRFKHASPSVTMRYLGIEDKEVEGILMNEIG